MLLRRSTRLMRMFSQKNKSLAQPVETVPTFPAPKLLPGELESFRFEREHDRIYAGFSHEELFGFKMGLKHSPAMKAEMVKYGGDDTGITLRH